MKVFKKLFVCLFAFVLVLVGMSFVKVNAAKDEGNSELRVIGASIRTVGNQGLRFVGNVGEFNTAEVKEYGIAIAYGSVSGFKIGDQVNDVDVLYATDPSGIDAEGNFYVVLFGIPKDQYTQIVSARPYVVLNDDTVIYGVKSTKRSIYEVAQAAMDDPGYVANEYVSSIIDDAYLDLMLYTGPNTSLHSAMVADFLADFSAFKGGTPITDPTRFFSDTYKGDGSSLGYLFLTNDAYKAKWGWVLDYINEVRAARSASAIEASTGQAEARGDIHNFLNLCGPGEKGGNSSFGSNYAFRTDYRYKLIVNDAELIPNTDCEGYTFDAWYSDSTFETFAGIRLYASGTYYANYTLDEYTLEFYDGSEKLELNPTSYTYTTGEFLLPAYEKAGFRFIAWYDNPEFTGNPVEKIIKGSSGNKQFYAKTEAILGYAINVNLNGGTHYATWEAMAADLLADINAVVKPAKAITAASFQNSSGAGGMRGDEWNAFFGTAAMWEKWGWLVPLLKENDPNGSAAAAFNTVITSPNHQIEVASPSQWFLMRDVKGFLNKNADTWYYSLNPIDFSDANIQALTWAAQTTAEPTSYIDNKGTVVLSTVLPTVYKVGYTFDGWYDNAEFSGDAITSVTGEITLYAKWNKVN